MVHLGRCPIAQGLMWPLVVVEPHIGIDAFPGLTDCLVSPEIHLLVLDGPPQPLHKVVVQVPPLAVHAYLDYDDPLSFRLGG